MCKDELLTLLKDGFWGILRGLLGKTLYEKVRARYKLGYWPDIKNPKTFNEKMIAFKLSGSEHLAPFADKVEVRGFIANLIGEKHLTKAYFIGEHLSSSDWAALPKGFVIKAAHSGGSMGIIIVKDKNKENYDDICRQIEKMQNYKYGRPSNEDWYLHIKPRILVEELLLDESGNVPSDYKLFCFHGKCKSIQLDTDRFSGHKRTYYSTDWEKQAFTVIYPTAETVPRPEKLDELVAIAEKLSHNFPFVRVDLYALKDRIVFGELTFTPEGGWGIFIPGEWDRKFGDML